MAKDEARVPQVQGAASVTLPHKDGDVGWASLPLSVHPIPSCAVGDTVEATVAAWDKGPLDVSNLITSINELVIGDKKYRVVPNPPKLPDGRTEMPRPAAPVPVKLTRLA